MEVETPNSGVTKLFKYANLFSYRNSTYQFNVPDIRIAILVKTVITYEHKGTSDRNDVISSDKRIAENKVVCNIGWIRNIVNFQPCSTITDKKKVAILT